MKPVPLTQEEIEAAGYQALANAVARSPALAAKVDLRALLVEVDSLAPACNNLDTYADLLDFLVLWHERIIATHPHYHLSHWDSALTANAHGYDGAAAYQYIFERALGITHRRVKVVKDAVVIPRPATPAVITPSVEAISVARESLETGNPRTRLTRAIYNTIRALHQDGLISDPPPPGANGGTRRKAEAERYTIWLNSVVSAVQTAIGTLDVEAPRLLVRDSVIRYWKHHRRNTRLAALDQPASSRA